MSSIHYEEMSKLAEKLIDNAALVETLLSKAGNPTHDAKNGDAPGDLKLFPMMQSSNFAVNDTDYIQASRIGGQNEENIHVNTTPRFDTPLTNPQFQLLNMSPQLPSRRSTRYGLAPFSHVKQDPSGIYNSPDLHYVDTCNSVCNTNHTAGHDTSPNFYGAEDMYSKPQQIVNTDGRDSNDIEQVESPYMIPNNPSFTPSINSRAGWKFDKCYDVQHEIGRGAFGAIFRATHRMASSNSVPWKNVAIKQTRPNLLDLRNRPNIRTHDDLERYCAEIKVLNHLRHGSPETSNVLYLYEYFMNGSDVFVVTELLGLDLDVWRQEREVFTEAMAINIGRSILNSLKFISERNVVHRDVKLQNVLFRCPGDFKSLKLVDFGMSRILGENEVVREFCGTVGYIAPEIYLGKSYRFEVDMFSFGVLLFQLLAAKRPFPTFNSQMLRRHTIEYRYSLNGRGWENVSDLAKDLVRKLLVSRVERLTAAQALEHPWFSLGQDSEFENPIHILNDEVVQRCTNSADRAAEKLILSHSIAAKCSPLLDASIPLDVRKNCVVLERYKESSICPKKKWFELFRKRFDRRERHERDGCPLLRSIATSCLQVHNSITQESYSISAATSTPSQLNGSSIEGPGPPIVRAGNARHAMPFGIVPSRKTQ